MLDKILYFILIVFVVLCIDEILKNVSNGTYGKKDGIKDFLNMVSKTKKEKEQGKK